MKIQRFLTSTFLPTKLFKKCVFYLGASMGVMILVSAAWAQPQHGGSLTFGIEYRVYGFDAIKARMYTATSLTAANLVMERLFDRGPKGEIVPLLGLSMTPSQEGKIWTVELRQGIRFHDGTSFNADAVVQHWRRLLDPENRFRGLLAINVIQSVEKAGEYSVRFRLKHPWKPFASVLSTANTMAALIPSPKAVADGTQNRIPVGTGPFVFRSWLENDRVIFSKNRDYWQAGRPYLDEVVIQIIPDAQTRYAALASGQVQMITTDRPNHVKKIEADPRFATIFGKGSGAGILIMNTRTAPLDDVRVRQALAHAWDQERYIKMVFQDTQPFVAQWYGDEFSCNDLGYRRPDLEKAGALVREYGRPVEIEYIHSATQRGKESGLIVQRLFKEIGVAVKTVPLDWGTLYKRMFERRFDLASGGIPGMNDMGVVTRLTFHSRSPWNLSGYSNAAVDQLLIEQKLSADQKAREKAWCEVARHINQDAPILLLCGRRYYLFTTLQVKGLPTPDGNSIRLGGVWLSRTEAR